MRGYQIADALRKRLVDVQVIDTRQGQSVEGIKDAICVFVKFANPMDLEYARHGRNVIIWNPADALATRKELPSLDAFDGIIFPSADAMNHFTTDGTPDFVPVVILGHADSRWQRTTVRRFRIAYLGSRASLPKRYRRFCSLRGLHRIYLENSHTTTMQHFFMKAATYSCHFSVREFDSAHFRFKPASKLIGAAASHANIVVSFDDSVKELLDDRYPYLVRSPDDTRAIVQHARKTYATNEWENGLRYLADVRERTSLESIVDQYIRYFRSFDG
jgi:hypothetical protein